MEEQEISMEIVNPHAAGIDVGSRSHWVAVGQHEKDIREYGVFDQDLFSMAEWLKEKKCTDSSHGKHRHILTIIRAICQGETNSAKLASLRHGNCHKSEAEIAAALQSNGRKDFLFALQQELETYDTCRKKLPNVM